MGVLVWESWRRRARHNRGPFRWVSRGVGVITVTESNFCTRCLKDSAYDEDPWAPRDANDGLNGAAGDAAEHVRTCVDAVTTDTVL